MVSNKIFHGKRILVTGGTGSFGSIFIRELLKYNPKEIIIFSRDEDKQGKMKRLYKNNNLRFLLGDVRDFHSVKDAVRGVQIIVHSAALKWITEIERNVWEAIKTNVIGTQNIIAAAKEAGVEKVIALSTDKAVEPINAYGTTKALQEKLITTANLSNVGTQTIFVSTRYGNVLGSRGSVVPLFHSLLKAGKPLTVTDSSMTRFLLTLPESVALVIKALEKGVGGEIFVRKIPAHSVADLAEVMLANVPKNKRRIIYTGIRPGEKIHETLISEAESTRTIELGDYYIILPQIQTPVIAKKYKNMKLLKKFRYSSDTTRRMKKDELAKVIKIYEQNYQNHTFETE